MQKQTKMLMLSYKCRTNVQINELSERKSPNGQIQDCVGFKMTADL